MMCQGQSLNQSHTVTVTISCFDVRRFYFRDLCPPLELTYELAFMFLTCVKNLYTSVSQWVFPLLRTKQLILQKEFQLGDSYNHVTNYNLYNHPFSAVTECRPAMCSFCEGILLKLYKFNCNYISQGIYKFSGTRKYA